MARLGQLISPALGRPANASESQAELSSDSVQSGYAVKRSPWLTPAFLLLFAVFSAVAVAVEPLLFGPYRQALSLLAFSTDTIYVGETLGLRPFFVTLSALLALCTSAPKAERGRLLLGLSMPVLGVMVLMDVALYRWSSNGGLGPFTIPGQIVTTLSMAAALLGAMFVSFNLPSNSVIPTVRRRSPRFAFAFLFMLATSLAIVVFALSTGRPYIESFRNFGLLGGIGPGLALFAPSFNIARYAVAWVTFRSPGAYLKLRSRGRVQNPLLERWLDDIATGIKEPPVISFLVPAFNEEGIIARTIQSMDIAASFYPGICKVVVVDNNSNDATFDIASDALTRADHVTGEVLQCPEPGKSKALNLGLQTMQSDIVVRVDADTVIDPDCLSKIARHFSDPAVGGVGGLPLPLNENHRFSRIRKVEVYHNVAWNRLGQMAIDSVIVVPGMLSSFRTHLVRETGGFVEGMNGEDTDMTVRIGRLGYRIVVDPDITFRTDVPTSIAEMREQRLRWSRSVFHVFARNRSSMWMLQGVRGAWLMPLSVLGFFRRSLVLPLIIYALAATVINPELVSLRHGATLLAVVFGPEVLITSMALIMHRQFKLLLSIPEYFIFRLFRAYVGLEVLLSLRYRIRERAVAVPVGQNVAVGSAI